MKFNLGEGIYRIANVIAWIWIIILLIISYNIFKTSGFAFKPFLILLFLTFGIPYIFKKIVRYIIDGF